MSEPIAEITEAELPQNVKTLWLKAISATEMQNHNYAVSLCQAVLKDAPGFVKARSLARTCAAKMTAGTKKKGNAVTQMFAGGFSASKIQSQAKKDARGALNKLEEELAKDPFSSQLNDIMFDTALTLNMLETAAFALETVRKGAPENTKLLHKLAEHYLASDQPDKASDVYNDIVKQDPADIDAVKGAKDSSARASMKKQKWDKSQDMGDLRRNAEGDQELEDADRAAMTREQMREKLARLMEQYQADQNNLPVVKQIADLYEQMEYWPDSYVFYNWAHQISNGDVTLKNKADLMKQKAADHNIKELEEKVAADPSNEELKAELAQIKSERSAESVSDAEKRVEQNPTDPQVRFELGLAYYNAGNYDGAIPHLQQAKRNPHIRTRVLLTLGRAFNEKGMRDIAVKQLEEALEELHAMDGTKKEVLYEMGLIYDKMGNNEGALGAFKLIYEVDYGYRDVAKRVESSYSS